MSTVTASFAKLAGVRKALQSSLDEPTGRLQIPIQYYAAGEVAHYFTEAAKELQVLRKELPDLYAEFAELPINPQVKMAQMTAGVEPEWRYGRSQLQRLARDIDQIFEIRANNELAAPATASRPARVFISHGRAPDWREVQAFIERDIRLPTLELAQEPNLGMTILGKLVDAAEQCDSAVIVMTGDDLDADGQARARENVIHEIGYFQGKYGLSRIVLLHEDDVNIPSNIQGLVYIPFPKGVIHATFGLLMREFNAMYRR